MKIIQQYMNNPLRNYNYIVYSEKSKEAIFFDPYDLKITLPVSESLNLNPKFLFNTHTHHDHIRDNEKFLELEGTSHIELMDGEVFKLSETEWVKAIYTPGHVDNHICYLLIEKDQMIGIICGDALFNAGVGNCKNGGNVDEHYCSTEMLRELLDDGTKLYPSHDYLLTNLKFALGVEPDNKDVEKLMNKRKVQNQEKEFINTNINDEKKINPFLRLEQLKKQEQFKSMSNKEIFIKLRKLRDNF